MPIRPENRKLYPADWKAISERIRFERAGGRCECTGQCGIDHVGRCERRHGERYRVEISHADYIEHAWRTVVLTVAHLNHRPDDCRDENLLAACQQCHLRYDARHHASTARRTRAAAAGQGELLK